MNSRQRFLRALRGDSVDRVPRGEICLEDEFIRALLGFRRRRAVMGVVEQRAAIAALDLDVVTIDATTGAQGLAADVDRDRLRVAGEWRESGLAIVVRLDGPLNRLVKSLGASGAVARLDARRTKPLGIVEQVAARLRRGLNRIAAAGATAVLLADDSPEIAGLLAAPDLLRRFYLPQLADFAHAARAYRLPVVLHVEPWHWPLLDELRRFSPAALQGLAGRPLDEFRAQSGPDVCLWGNADPAWLAAPHAVDEIRAEVGRMLAAGQPRYIFGSAAGLRAGLDVDTVLALYESLDSLRERPR